MKMVLRYYITFHIPSTNPYCLLNCGGGGGNVESYYKIYIYLFPYSLFTFILHGFVFLHSLRERYKISHIEPTHSIQCEKMHQNLHFPWYSQTAKCFYHFSSSYPKNGLSDIVAKMSNFKLFFLLFNVRATYL